MRLGDTEGLGQSKFVPSQNYIFKNKDKLIYKDWAYSLLER